MLERIQMIGIFIVFLTLFMSFIISGLLINAMQMSLWIFVKPISPWLYRKVNRYLLASLWNRKFLKFCFVIIINNIFF